MIYWNQFGHLQQHTNTVPMKVKPYPSHDRVFSNPKANDIRLLLITRKLSTSATTNEIQARVFANLDSVYNGLKRLVDSDPSRSINLIVADFSDIPFAEQVSNEG